MSSRVRNDEQNVGVKNHEVKGSSFLRKVRSLDCVHVRCSPQASKKPLSYFKHQCDWHGFGLYDDETVDSPSLLASRFSHAASRRKYRNRGLARPTQPSASFSDLSLLKDDCKKASTANLDEVGVGGSTSSTPEEVSGLPAGPEGGSVTFTIMNLLSGAGTVVNASIFLVLLLATLVDVRNPQRRNFLDDSSSPFYYDALSTEVVYPPFRYEATASDGNNAHVVGKHSRRKLGLGSAMIGSVTDALSPILPFAGGVDLRRLEHWNGEEEGSWLASTFLGWGNRIGSWGRHDGGGGESSLDVGSMPRGGNSETGSTSKANVNFTKRKNNKKMGPRSLILAGPEPFLSTKAISQLTLGDIGVAFEYAINFGREKFDPVKFRANHDGGKPLSSRMKEALDSMDQVVVRSRGEGILPPQTGTIPSSWDDERRGSGPLSHEAGFGDVDALLFCAAMRLFAEWRIVRQVPEGYKGYAVGMGLGHKDVVQNVAKIEGAVHDFVNEQVERYETIQEEEVSAKEANASSPLLKPSLPHSPTLRELLQREIEIDLHPTSRLPRLKEKSAAMGLLWVRRQLQYQTAIFANLKLVPKRYPTTVLAVAAAYSEVYSNYHGWAVQKIFNYSFQAAPEVAVLFRFMNPKKLNEVTTAALDGQFQEAEEAQKGSKSQDSTSSINRGASNDVGNDSSADRQKDSQAFLDQISCEESENNNPILRISSHVACEWDKLGKHVSGEVDKLGRQIGNEWEKIFSGAIRIFQNDERYKNLGRGRSKGGREGKNGLSGEALEKYISKQMELDAQSHISVYLRVAQPLLRDLGGLFEEKNMNDPTKV